MRNFPAEWLPSPDTLGITPICSPQSRSFFWFSFPFHKSVFFFIHFTCFRWLIFSFLCKKKLLSITIWHTIFSLLVLFVHFDHMHIYRDSILLLSPHKTFNIYQSVRHPNTTIIIIIFFCYLRNENLLNSFSAYLLSKSINVYNLFFSHGINVTSMPLPLLCYSLFTLLKMLFSHVMCDSLKSIQYNWWHFIVW